MANIQMISELFPKAGPKIGSIKNTYVKYT